MKKDLSSLFAEHISDKFSLYNKLLVSHGYDHLLIAAGNPLTPFRDDNEYGFKVNPYFKEWLPLANVPGCFVHVDVGRDKPQLLYMRRHSAWTRASSEPSRHWVSSVAVSCISAAEDLTRERSINWDRTAFIGQTECCPPAVLAGNVNSQALIDAIDYYRAYKSEHERSCLRLANAVCARGHLAAERVFLDGGSEFDVHMAYLQATGQRANDLPYQSTVAINENAAFLTYGSELNRQNPVRSRSLLLDAGSGYHGYAADVTRTSVHTDGCGMDRNFEVLVQRVDAIEQELVSLAVPGTAFEKLHGLSLQAVAQALVDFNFYEGSAESCVEQGVCAAFYPHGLGHLLGLQVHDKGGFLTSPTGEKKVLLTAHKFLRLTRVLEAGMVLTIEPGIYFIPQVLNALRDDRRHKAINWGWVEAFSPYGGIRIEDDIAVHACSTENITRDAFSALRTEK